MLLIVVALKWSNILIAYLYSFYYVYLILILKLIYTDYKYVMYSMYANWMHRSL